MNINLGGGQLLGLYLLQLFGVDGKFRVFFSGGTGGDELLPHIAGEVFVRRLPALVPVCTALVNVKGAGIGVLEDDPLQILHDLRNLFPAAHERSHKAQVHTGFLRNRDGQSLYRRVHAGNGLVMLDGPLGEHIRLANQLTLVTQDLQRTQQRVGGILSESKPVSGTAQQAVLLRELVIELVEIGLLGQDFPILRPA